MFRSFLAITLAIIAGAVACPAQEKKSAAELLKAWDTFDLYVRATHKELSKMQLQFSGAESSEIRSRVQKAYRAKRAAAIARSNEAWDAVNTFLAKYPRNQIVLARRLSDQTFNQTPILTRATDALTLYGLTKKGEYLNQAAELHGKSYRYAKATELWQQAAQRAEVFDTLKSLGKSCMNSGHFQEAASAFERAKKIAAKEREQKEMDRFATTAANYVKFWEREQVIRKAEATKDDLPRVEFETTRGTFVIELFEDQAPNTVANIINLTESGFYNGLPFHRNVAWFMIQGGDPKGDGSGGPGYSIKDEYDHPEARNHFVGSLSMANNSRPNTNGSQFFVTNSCTYFLNGRHTVFGRVIDGLEVAQVTPIDAKDPNGKAAAFFIKKARVLRKRAHPYVVEKVR
jgi:cyclophilin family peptidyl-prolyl cis-trans isomerase/cytochrome c-type biogenesis protein CcmH/NrfG